MTTTAKQLLEQVLALDNDDRAELVDRLFASIEAGKDPDYDAAWEAEIRERIAQIDRGDVKLIPWREAMEQVRRGVNDDK